jgi:hypothetical protein
VSEAKAVTEAAIFEALAASVTSAAVYQDVPQDAPLPLVVIGDMKSLPIGARDDVDRRISVIVVAMVEAEERAPLFALQRDIVSALDGRTFLPAGWTLAVTFDDDDAQLGEDGVTYIGTSAFSVLALRD